MIKQPRIIFENTRLLVVHKPAGLIVHSDGKTDEHTLSDWLIENISGIESVGEPWIKDNGETINRPGIVHRLDRETSGIMVIAKTQESFDFLKDKFKNRKIRKEYRAIVSGIFKDDQLFGIINKSIGRSPNDFRRWSAQPGSRGVLREAITKYKVLACTGKGNDGFSYVKAEPKTGRTHQIRVHFKALHHPIIGDELYGDKLSLRINTNRIMLHSYSIEFEDMDGDVVKFTDDLPNDFIDTLKKLELNVLVDD